MRTAAIALAIALVTATACGGESASHHSKYLYMQKCAACHGVASGQDTPVERAANLLDASSRPQLEQVRRAIIDGRPGMPKGLLGGSDVDQIAAYLSGQAQ
jgi:mono/diheme cytochrome c family protein